MILNFVILILFDVNGKRLLIVFIVDVLLVLLGLMSFRMCFDFILKLSLEIVIFWL